MYVWVNAKLHAMCTGCWDRQPVHSHTDPLRIDCPHGHGPILRYH